MKKIKGKKEKASHHSLGATDSLLPQKGMDEPQIGGKKRLLTTFCHHL